MAADPSLFDDEPPPRPPFPATADFPDSMTLGEARRILLALDDEGAKCPCCTQRAQVYHRSISGTMARDLITLYKAGGADDYIHTPTRFGGFDGDFCKLRFWGLIVRKPDERREDGSTRTGWWKVTARGVAYIQRRVTVTKTVLIYDDACLGFEGPADDIVRALGRKFRYDDLMAGDG